MKKSLLLALAMAASVSQAQSSEFIPSSIFDRDAVSWQDRQWFPVAALMYLNFGEWLSYETDLDKELLIEAVADRLTGEVSRLSRELDALMAKQRRSKPMGEIDTLALAQLSARLEKLRGLEIDATARHCLDLAKAHRLGTPAVRLQLQYLLFTGPHCAPVGSQEPSCLRDWQTGSPPEAD